MSETINTNQPNETTVNPNQQPQTAPPPQPPIEDAEISFEQSAQEENLVGQNASAQEQPSAREVLETLQPKTAPKKWVFGPEDMKREYVQRPLSYIGKMHWFSLVGEVIERDLGGPDGISVNSLLFSARQGTGGALTIEDFRDADTFIQAVGKILRVAPRFLLDSYCIWLQVPDYEWDLAQRLMSLPPEEGGLTDEDGLEMIEIFIDQNYDALYDFFTKHLRKLQKRVKARIDARRS